MAGSSSYDTTTACAAASAPASVSATHNAALSCDYITNSPDTVDMTEAEVNEMCENSQPWCVRASPSHSLVLFFGSDAPRARFFGGAGCKSGSTR